MGTREKHWQARGWINGEEVTWCAHTLRGLRNAAGQELRHKEAEREVYGRGEPLLWFENMAPGVASTRVHRHYTYVLLGRDTRRDQRILALAEQAGYDLKPMSASEDPQEQAGWYRFTWEEEPYAYLYKGRRPDYVGSFGDVVQQFTAETMIPEKGPDYVDPFEGVSPLPLHEIRTIFKAKDEATANEYISRGWHLIGLESVSDGYPVHPTSATIFVLGHPEDQAR